MHAWFAVRRIDLDCTQSTFLCFCEVTKIQVGGGSVFKSDNAIGIDLDGSIAQAKHFAPVVGMRGGLGQAKIRRPVIGIRSSRLDTGATAFLMPLLRNQQLPKRHPGCGIFWILLQCIPQVLLCSRTLFILQRDAGTMILFPRIRRNLQVCR